MTYTILYLLLTTKSFLVILISVNVNNTIKNNEVRIIIIRVISITCSEKCQFPSILISSSKEQGIRI
jgi:hypothetical protein